MIHLPLAYLFATVLGAIVWFACYWIRPDVRRVMVGMSIAGLPLALSDVFYVPSYWKPETIGRIPIGIEGFLFSFEAAGICAVLYAVSRKRRFVERDPAKSRTRLAFKVLPLILPVAVGDVVTSVAQTNLEWGLYFGLLAGITATVVVRRDLLEPAVLGGLAFLPIYTVALIVWVAVFPSVHGWFTLHQMPHRYLLGVPLTEIVFGGLFAAYWTGLYPVIFDHRFTRL